MLGPRWLHSWVAVAGVVAASVGATTWLVSAVGAAPGDASAVGFAADFTGQAGGTPIALNESRGQVLAPPGGSATLAGDATLITPISPVLVLSR